MNKDFIKEIFKGDKHLIKRRDIQWVEVPKYDEISVISLYDKLI